MIMGNFGKNWFLLLILSSISSSVLSRSEADEISKEDGENIESASVLILKNSSSSQFSEQIKIKQIEVQAHKILSHFAIKADEFKFFHFLKNKSGDEFEMPRSFRSHLEILDNSCEYKGLNYDEISFIRSKKIKLSGSAQPSFNEYYKLAHGLYNHKDVFVIDLRLEDHLYIENEGTDQINAYSLHGAHNGINWGLNSKQVKAKESSLINVLQNGKHNRNERVIIVSEVKKEGKLNRNGEKIGDVSQWKVDIINFKYRNIVSEEDVLERISPSYHYMRIGITDLHRPTEKNVDELIDAWKIISQENPNAIVHFHCKAGRGRTTTAMCMFEMLTSDLEQLKKFSAEDIMNMHYKLGGSDLNKIYNESVTVPNADWSAERKLFLKNFHSYLIEQKIKNPLDPAMWQSWSEWVKNKPDAQAESLSDSLHSESKKKLYRNGAN